MVNKFKKKEGNVMEMFCLQLLCFQKISRPTSRRELEILEGLGTQRSRKFHGGGGFEY